jgi:hypothetical protein
VCEREREGIYVLTRWLVSQTPPVSLRVFDPPDPPDVADPDGGVSLIVSVSSAPFSTTVLSVSDGSRSGEIGEIEEIGERMVVMVACMRGRITLLDVILSDTHTRDPLEEAQAWLSHFTDDHHVHRSACVFQSPDYRQ